MQVLMFVISLSLFCTSLAGAGPMGTLVAALADYEDYKSRARTLLDEADENNRQHYTVNPKRMIELFNQIYDTEKHVYEGLEDEWKSELGDKAPRLKAHLFYSLHIALGRLRQIMGYAIDRQTGRKWNVVAAMRAKEEEMLKIADLDVTAAKIAAGIK